MTCDEVVVLEVVLEAPRIFKGAQAEIAGHVVARRIVDMVLQAVPVDEDTLAEVAVVLVLLG